MSKYTTQLRWIVENEQKVVPYSEKERYTKAVYRKIGLSEYPIYDETYRRILNDKIIDHFFFREIGFETVAQFAWYMRRTMNEIMPYYNKLYEAELMVDDPLSDFDKTWRETWDRDIDDTGTIGNVNESTTEVDTSGTTNNRNVFQDTPRSLLGNTGTPTIENADYATTVTYDDGGSTDESTTTVNGEATRTTDMNRDDSGWRERNESGRNVAQIELFEKLKDKYMNLDMEIINHLEDLFMGLW